MTTSNRPPWALAQAGRPTRETALTTESKRCPSVRAHATGAVPRRRRSFISPSRSGRRRARPRAWWRPAIGMVSGSRRRTGPIPSSCWRNKRRPACASSCRSATAGCWCRRSRSSAARPIRWRRTLPPDPGPGSTYSCAAMRTCRTSAPSRAPDRRLVFSINDFDETLPGPFEWDVKRLAASFAVAGRDRGFDAKQRSAMTWTVARATARRCGSSPGMDSTSGTPPRHRRDARAVRPRPGPEGPKRFEANVAKARSKDSLRALAKLTQRRRRAPDHGRSPADRADRGPRPGGAGHANS